VIFLNWPAGVNNRLPSGANVNLRKNEDRASLAYIFDVFVAPTRGDADGITAGSGIEGAGD